MGLIIRKKSDLTWLHIDSVLGQFILSKFYFSEDNDTFQIVELGQSKRKPYLVTEVTLYDDVNSGSAETFIDIIDLSLRLEELGYPAFDYTGMMPSPVIGGMTDKGNFNPITGNPALLDISGTIGQVYRVITTSDYDFGSGLISLKENDIIEHNGSIWTKFADNNQQGSGSNFKNLFNASTNSPTLANGFGSNGDYYKVSVGGDVDFGAGLVSLLANDFIYYNGYTGIWDLWFRESTPSSTPIASEVDSGTVKTNVTVADPVVYLKEEVDTLVQQAIGGQLSYFFFKTISDVAGYYKMLLNPSIGVGQDITVLGATGTTTIANFVTEPNAPNKTYIPKGYFRSLFHAKKTGAGNATVFFEIYKRNLAGTETLLVTSTVTDTNLTTSTLEYTLQAYLATQVAILTTDRIVYRFKTIVASGTPDVSIYIEDAYLSGVDVPSYIVSVGDTGNSILQNLGVWVKFNQASSGAYPFAGASLNSGVIQGVMTTSFINEYTNGHVRFMANLGTANSGYRFTDGNNYPSILLKGTTFFGIICPVITTNLSVIIGMPTQGSLTGVAEVATIGAWFNITGNQIQAKCAYTSLVTAGSSATITATEWLMTMIEVIDNDAVNKRVRFKVKKLDGTVVYNEDITTNIPPYDSTNVNSMGTGVRAIKTIAPVGASENILGLQAMGFWANKPNWLLNF